MTTPTAEERLLSVVIPTYNYAALVGRAIRSVTEQMNDAIELIVVDDGSTDETPTVLGALTPPPSLAWRFVRQENAGPAAARNHGCRLATGKFVLFLDADDELLPGAIGVILDTVRTHPEAGLILGAHINCFQDGREKFASPTPVRGSARQRIDDYLLRKRISVLHGACIFRRDLLKRRPYPEQLRQTEDIPVFAYLLAHATVALVQQPLARIHKHPDSLRHNTAYARASYQTLVNEVFASLPDECQVLRTAYETKRALSVFRVCCEAGESDNALHYYRLALKADWRRTLRWKYLWKYLRLRLQAKGNR